MKRRGSLFGAGAVCMAVSIAALLLILLLAGGKDPFLNGFLVLLALVAVVLFLLGLALGVLSLLASKR